MDEIQRRRQCRRCAYWNLVDAATIGCTSWLRREEDGDSIKERLREALAQHKDASEADHVRESEERTKQELADVKRELAAMAATQQIILTKLQTILDDKQQS